MSKPTALLMNRYLLVPFSLGLTQLAMNRSGLLKAFCAEHRWATALLFGFVGSIVSAIVGWKSLQAPLQFIYSCFLKPLGYHGHNQQDRLESFYQDQADGMLLDHVKRYRESLQTDFCDRYFFPQSMMLPVEVCFVVARPCSNSVLLNLNSKLLF